MLEFLAGIFAALFAASLPTWGILIATAILLIIAVEAEKGSVATATLAIMLTVAVVVGHGTLALLWLQRVGFVKSLALWFLLGAVYSFIKWPLYVKSKVNEYKDFRARFLEGRGAKTLTPQLAFQLAEELRKYHPSISTVHPKASDHKSDIIRWMSYWPFSFVGMLLSDIVAKAWHHIYNFLSSTYDRIAKVIYSEVEKDVSLMEAGKELDREERSKIDAQVKAGSYRSKA